MQFVKDAVYFLINYVINRIPSRLIRMFFYKILSSGNISRKASIGMGVRILDIRNVAIGEYSNINFGCVLDGRGALLSIGRNVDIAPQVNIWTLQHDVDSKNYASHAESVCIEDHCWLANRVILLPGSHVKKGSVIGAGTVFKGASDEGDVFVGAKARKVKQRAENLDYSLARIRRFR